MMSLNFLFNPKAANPTPSRYSDNNSGKQSGSRILPSSAGGSERWRWTSLAGCWRWWRGTPSRWKIHWGRTSRMTMWAPTDRAGRTLPKPTTCERERKRRDINKWRKKTKTNKPQWISSLLSLTFLSSGTTSCKKKKLSEIQPFCVCTTSGGVLLCINNDTRVWNECAFGYLTRRRKDISLVFLGVDG